MTLKVCLFIGSEWSRNVIRRYALATMLPWGTENVYETLGTQNCIENYRSRGSSSPAEVQRQIEFWRERLAREGLHLRQARVPSRSYLA